MGQVKARVEKDLNRAGSTYTKAHLAKLFGEEM